MPRIAFTEDFDWSPIPAVTIAYKAGMVEMVTTPCAEAAIAAGKAHMDGKAANEPEPADPKDAAS